MGSEPVPRPSSAEPLPGGWYSGGALRGGLRVEGGGLTSDSGTVVCQEKAVMKLVG